MIPHGIVTIIYPASLRMMLCRLCTRPIQSLEPADRGLGVSLRLL